MPNLAWFHPQIVHFAIVLLAAGVFFRWVSLTGRAAWTGPAAAALLLAGTAAAVLAARSGDDAHGPVERVPGVRAAVVAHEEWGERARNVFLVVAGLEVLALALRPVRVKRGLTIVSALVGLGGGFALYEAGAHGGDLVYRYAGGVGIRSGDTVDVGRLLLAGLYHSAQRARARHDSAAAAELFAELGRRFPGDTSVRLLAIESLVQDRGDGTAALTELAGLAVPPPADRRLRLRYGLLKADAFLTAGRTDSARATLEALARDFPDAPRVQERLDALR